MAVYDANLKNIIDEFINDGKIIVDNAVDRYFIKEHNAIKLSDNKYSLVINVELMDNLDIKKRDKKQIKTTIEKEYTDNYFDFKFTMRGQNELETKILHAQSTGTAQQYNDDILQFFGYDPKKMDHLQKQNKYFNPAGFEIRFVNDLKFVLGDKGLMP